MAIEKIYLDYEKAIQLVTKYMPSGEFESKPALMHCVRVGGYLYESGYGRDIVLAGFLHDILEDSDVSSDLIAAEFGVEVLEIVKACSKNNSILDSDLKKVDLIDRCFKNGFSAVIVKAADILDNYKYYERTNNDGEIKYCSKLAKLFFEKLGFGGGELANENLVSGLREFYDKYPL